MRRWWGERCHVSSERSHLKICVCNLLRLLARQKLGPTSRSSLFMYWTSTHSTILDIKPIAQTPCYSAKPETYADIDLDLRTLSRRYRFPFAAYSGILILELEIAWVQPLGKRTYRDTSVFFTSSSRCHTQCRTIRYAIPIISVSGRF